MFSELKPIFQKIFNLKNLNQYGNAQLLFLLGEHIVQDYYTLNRTLATSKLLRIDLCLMMLLTR